MTIGQGYFRSYLGSIPRSNFYPNKKCPNPRCAGQKQTPNHLLLECQLYQIQRKTAFFGLAKSLQLNLKDLNIRILLATKDGINATAQYIQDTKIGIKKWILGQLENGESRNRGG